MEGVFGTENDWEGFLVLHVVLIVGIACGTENFRLCVDYVDGIRGTTNSEEHCYEIGLLEMEGVQV